MRCVVTGAGGFLGSALVRRLASGGCGEVIACTSQRENMKQRVTAASLTNVSIVSREALLEGTGLLEEGDVLVNCAFPRSTQDGRDVARGLSYIARLLTLARAAGCRVVNVSSQSVYDPHRTAPATETDEPCPTSAYAVGKYAVELMVEAQIVSGRRVNVRLASLIGPGFDARLVNRFVHEVIRGNDLQIVAGGTQGGVYDFMDVRDAAEGLATLVESPGDWEPVYNLGSSQPATLEAIARRVVARGVALGVPPVRVVVQGAADGDARSSGRLPVNSSLDVSLFTRSFGWAPGHSLDDTISDIFASCVATRPGE